MAVTSSGLGEATERGRGVRRGRMRRARARIRTLRTPRPKPRAREAGWIKVGSLGLRLVAEREF
jgi:hypothetical protein